MRVSISVNRPFHAVLMANTLSHLDQDVMIYSGAPRRYFSGLDQRVATAFIPAPILGASYKLKISLPGPVDRFDTWLFDRSVSIRISRSDLFVGWASQALHSARRARLLGAKFVLDRACPHRDFQDRIVAEEAERVGAKARKQAPWFRDRQLEEYELADAILVPSDYTMKTFPDHLQAKLLKAPLLGRCRVPESVSVVRKKPFTVGVLGGNPLRKGYLYLLQAWKRLALPDAQLLLRAGDFAGLPVLKELMGSLPNVERVGYLPDISDFYRRCDVFVLPSIDDGFGMALVEAMVHQNACIATTHCGASEIITSGHDGLVVPPGDSDALAHAILSVYENEELRQELALQAGRTAGAFLESRAYEAAMVKMLEMMGKDTSLQ